ncbi:adenylosuccinate lyase [Candidatus Bathyarchaeota archaeon]|nr:MAG: adenylosuccinate lyase [Candidatus Bathyarchaeota archaeon]
MPILPIDTGRYGSPEMRRIFEEENRLQRWLDVEAAVAEAQAFVGDIPEEAAEEIRRNANTKIVTLDHVKGIEKEIRHDLMAMVVALSEASTGEGLEEILGSRVRKHRSLLIVGRTHGRHAGVITLGLKFAVWLEEVRRYQQRLKQVKERVLVGKILGIVGNGAGLGKNALKIQERALHKLGLKPAGLVTQVIQRDLHAETVCYLSLLGSSLDKFATEIRNLQRSEISEVMEPFERDKQVGSSALPSKRNPELSERVSSMAKLMRGLVIPALENIPLWHERDISNSASERFIFPMSFILVDEMLRLVTRVLDGLEVLPKNMERNLELSQGALLAERIVNSLVEKGVPRQDAHERIRKISIRAFDNKIPFSKLLLEDKFISKRLKPKEIKEALDYRTYLGVTRELVNLALKE